jgi:FKBP-type peptidyl-prolyl cis-trans isomerase FklB
MPVGSTWEVYIPYEQAYGERGAGEDIKPFSMLIFKIELIEIVKDDNTPAKDGKK